MAFAEAVADPEHERALPAPPASPVVAVMQPYVFPYLGYLNLVCASDVFVFYDDVHYIPRGWINRNRLLVGGAAHTFTVPVAQASQNLLIRDVATHEFARFRSRFLRQLECAYRRAPHYEATRDLVQAVLALEAPGIAELAMRSVQLVCQRLGIQRCFVRSSERCAASRGAPRAERLIHITRSFGASRYVNSPGGAALYDPAAFAAQGVALRFVQAQLEPYAQVGGGPFVPGLSVLDALMHNPVDVVARMAHRFALV